MRLLRAALLVLLSLPCAAETAHADPIDQAFEPPVGHLALGFGLLTPFHIVNLRITGSFDVPALLHTRGGLHLGVGLNEADDDSSGSLLWELYAGYPLFSWEGSSTYAYALDQSRTTTHITTTYTEVEVPTTDHLLVEAGLIHGSLVFNLPAGAGETSRRDDWQRVTHLAAGVRYQYTWNARLIDGEHVTGTNAFWAHFLLGGLGAPGAEASLDGDPVQEQAWGWKVGAQLNAWLNSVTPLVAEIGQTPTPNSWWFTFAVDIPVWHFADTTPQ